LGREAIRAIEFRGWIWPSRGGGWPYRVDWFSVLHCQECLPNSPLIGELEAAGYKPELTGSGERVLPAAITEAVITEGSTVPRRVTHAGVCKVQRFSFDLR
jgi:hypothetical protein